MGLFTTRETVIVFLVAGDVLARNTVVAKSDRVRSHRLFSALYVELDELSRKKTTLRSTFAGTAKYKKSITMIFTADARVGNE